MSAILFNLATYWLMRGTTEVNPRGIRWRLFTIVDDLDFADDLALFLHINISRTRPTDFKPLDSR